MERTRGGWRALDKVYGRGGAKNLGEGLSPSAKVLATNGTPSATPTQRPLTSKRPHSFREYKALRERKRRGGGYLGGRVPVFSTAEMALSRKAP